MVVVRHVVRHAGSHFIPPRSRTLQRAYASRVDIPQAPPPFPVIETCPSPTCLCREMPAGLDIEREQNINGSMAAYAEQVLICTGRSDWKSRIEDEEESVLVRGLKSLLGPRGKYSDPYHNVLITNASFPSSKTPAAHRETTAGPSSADPDHIGPTASAFLLPSFQYVPTIPTRSTGIEALVRAYVLPSQLHQSHERLTGAQQNALLRQPELQTRFEGTRQVDEILVLICGHQSRDARCGVLGPILEREFEEKLLRQNVPLLMDAPTTQAKVIDHNFQAYKPEARVGQISHIGGHKWAGNVIIYIPPAFKSNALAGKGIWYGRVAPGHVEGIVEKTILGGKVIKELFRGGIDQDRKITRLP